MFKITLALATLLMIGNQEEDAQFVCEVLPNGDLECVAEPLDEDGKPILVLEPCGYLYDGMRCV